MSDKVTEFEWKLRAIKNLAPNCSFSTDNDGKLDWGNGNPLDEPSETKINEEIAKLKADYDSQEYARTRKPLYPEIGDQLDALYHAGVFPKEMADKIKAVKDANPKPE